MSDIPPLRDPPPLARPMPDKMTDEERRRYGVWKYCNDPPGGECTAEVAMIEGYEHLPYFDMRNGEARDASSLLVRPTIEEGYHWVPVAGVTPDEATHVIDAYIMSAYCQLHLHKPSNLPEAHYRKAAIVLGTSRAVMTKYYGLCDGDFIGGELAKVLINVKRDDAGTKRYTLGAATTQALRDELKDGFKLVKLEKDAISSMLSSSIGTLALQGYSLIMTSHHYLSDPATQSRRAYKVVEGQFWNHTDVKAWFESETELIRDCAWHKAGHPVIMNLKEQFATDEKVAIMIREAGAGSAASRLPAQEAQLRTANSYLALMSAVDPLFRMFGGSSDPSVLGDMIRVIRSWPRDGGVVDVPATWPEDITSRRKALEWLGDVLARNAPRVAYCYGFYCALTEQNQAMSGAGAADTLKTSYSLLKLKTQCHATYLEGMLSYADFNAARNKKRMEGTFSSPVLPFLESSVAES